jgi:integrase
MPTDRSVGRLKPEPRFLTAEQVEAVAAQLDTTYPCGLLVRFAAWTGLRAGELAGLNIGDVDGASQGRTRGVTHQPEPTSPINRNRVTHQPETILSHINRVHTQAWCAAKDLNPEPAD